jgi:hypothetical protein
VRLLIHGTQQFREITLDGQSGQLIRQGLFLFCYHAHPGVFLQKQCKFQFIGLFCATLCRAKQREKYKLFGPLLQIAAALLQRGKKMKR